MNTLVTKFEKIGARLKFASARGGRRSPDFNVDVRRDKLGSHFTIGIRENSNLDINILDIQPELRHLLLLIRDQSVKHKFLCGHDERDWFVAAIPEKSGATNVHAAMEALKPEEVLAAQTQKHVKTQFKNRRRNDAFVRQGEWFFVPAPEINPDDWYLIKNEPLMRGRGKPHMAEYVYRLGGRTVYVNSSYPQGVTEAVYKNIIKNPQNKGMSFTARRLDPTVYVKGKITHPDHKTIVLDYWHRVIPNTENRAASMKFMAFID